ncbi:hypothetical protein CCACVL1_29287 [Corchorus capsularis]|uniref:Uncharacterized protein n=1 Tax=Corchorus capsularis TaxID=210143 RepID=A0A1R3G2N6_COCAP|nr:hypothetical protein CCACVL1_29287 [Corchorus capsularis]
MRVGKEEQLTQRELNHAFGRNRGERTKMKIG